MRRWLKPFPVKFCAISQMRLGCRGISVANYWVDTAEVHGLKRVVSVSENFKREDESLITANTILKNSLGTDYLEEFNRRTSLKE